MNEQELIRRCIAGDAEAWRELVEVTTPRIRALAATILRALGARAADADVDDVRSAVLESLVAGDARVLRSFRWQCSFDTWLRVLVRTACVRSLRRKTVDAKDVPLQKPEGLPLDRLLSAESRAAVREEVDALPPRERRVLTMFFVDGKGYREISDALKLPMGTVATLLARTRARLRERLLDRGMDPGS